MDKANGVVSGNDCMVWINNEIWDEIKSFEWKVTGNFEEVNFLGDPRTYKKYMGFDGEGTITMNKKKSRGAQLLAEAYKTGIMPDVKIVTKTTNKSTGMSERAVFTGITFSEFGGKSEAKGLSEEELPLSFAEYEFLEYM